MIQPLVDTLCEDDRWEAAGLDALAEHTARATLAHLGLEAADFEIALLGCDDARISVLNADFRDKPTPTNVLSWPSEDLAPEDEGARPDVPAPWAPGEPHHLGDVALAYETCAREAADQNKAFNAHVTHLVVHGVLHLLGYDHIREGDAGLMEQLELEILGKLGVEDPY